MTERANEIWKERLSEIAAALLALFIVYRLLERIDFTDVVRTVFGSFYNLVLFVAPFYALVSILATFILITVVIYLFIKLREVRSEEYRTYLAPRPPRKAGETARRLDWETVLKHRDSANPAEWRVAILEADRILARVLTEHGFEGETVAEQLRAVPRKLHSLDGVWKAHKVRNAIAHEGSAYTLTERERDQTIARYERFFREMGALD